MESDKQHNLKTNIIFYGAGICVIIVFWIIVQQVLVTIGTTELIGTRQRYLVGEEITSYRKVFLGETLYTINTAYYSGIVDGEVLISLVVCNGYGFTSFDLHMRLGTVVQLGERNFKVTNYNNDSLELMDISAGALYKDVPVLNIRSTVLNYRL